MFGFIKDESDNSFYRKFGAVTVRYIQASEKIPFPYMMGFETEFFKKHLPIKLIASVIEPFMKYFRFFNKTITYLMIFLLFGFAYFTFTAKPIASAPDMSVLLIIPISFYVAMLISLVAHESAHAAIAEKFYQKHYQKSALNSVGYAIMPIFVVAFIISALVFGLGSSIVINFAALAIFSGAYVRLIDEEKYYMPLPVEEKVEILMAGVFLNFLLGIVFFIPYIAYTALYGVQITSQLYFFLMSMSLLNLSLMILNILPIFGTDGYQVSMLFSEKHENLNKAINFAAILLILAVGYIVAITWKWL